MVSGKEVKLNLVETNYKKTHLWGKKHKKLLNYLEGIDIFPIFAATIIKNYNMSIDTYKLTSMEEPTDEVLSQLMREAAQDAQKANEQATQRYFEELRQAAAAI